MRHKRLHNVNSTCDGVRFLSQSYGNFNRKVVNLYVHLWVDTRAVEWPSTTSVLQIVTRTMRTGDCADGCDGGPSAICVFNYVIGVCYEFNLLIVIVSASLAISHHDCVAVSAGIQCTTKEMLRTKELEKELLRNVHLLSHNSIAAWSPVDATNNDINNCFVRFAQCTRKAARCVRVSSGAPLVFHHLRSLFSAFVAVFRFLLPTFVSVLLISCDAWRFSFRSASPINLENCWTNCSRWFSVIRWDCRWIDAAKGQLVIADDRTVLSSSVA